MDCIFCKIVQGNVPAKILTQTENSLAFLDVFPLTKGHCLVIPKKHYAKIQELSEEDNLDLFATMHKILSRVDTITNSTLIAIHNGKESGQEIPHVHIHLIPRKPEDGAGPVHSMFKHRPKLSEKETLEIYEKLKI